MNLIIFLVFTFILISQFLNFSNCLIFKREHSVQEQTNNTNGMV
jgi:hypothetical protein